MPIPNDVISGGAVLGLCAVGAMGASGLPPGAGSEWAGPGTLPWCSLAAMAFFGICLIVTGLIRRSATGFDISPKACAFFAFWVGYMVLMTWLGQWLSHQDFVDIPHNGGFAIATTLFLLVALPLLGRRRPLEILCVAFGASAVLTIVFSGFFKVQLP